LNQYLNIESIFVWLCEKEKIRKVIHCLLNKFSIVWKIWHNAEKYDTMLKNMTQCWKIWHNAEKYDKMLKNMTQCWKIWHNAEKYDTMLKNMTQCWKIWHNAEKYDTMLKKYDTMIIKWTGIGTYHWILLSLLRCIVCTFTPTTVDFIRVFSWFKVFLVLPCKDLCKTKTTPLIIELHILWTSFIVLILNVSV